MSAQQELRMPSTDEGVETTASIIRTFVLQRGGRAPLSLLNQRFALARRPCAEAFALLIVRRQLTVDRGGNVWTNDPHANEETSPLRVRAVLRTDDGDLPARGDVELGVHELLHAQVHGVEVLAYAGPERLAQVPNGAPLGLQITARREGRR